MLRALMVTFALVALALPAQAQKPPEKAAPPPATQKAAEKAFSDASKHYSAGEYEDAVKGFLSAYQLVPANPLLFNIGQAYRLAGHKDKALAYYEKYVEFEPGGAQVPEAKEHTRVLKEEVETKRREQEARDAEERSKREAASAAARAEEDKRRTAEIAHKREEAASAGRGLRIGGIVVGLAGVAAVGTGAALAASDGKLSGKAAAVGGVGVAAIVAG